jgi:hypothetical protein
MEGLKFVNFSDPLNRWDIDKVILICNEVKRYADKHNLNKVELHRVEDNTWSDKENQRYDIEIRYMKGNQLIQQKLLMLKGELLDGDEFHNRINEFYSI